MTEYSKSEAASESKQAANEIREGLGNVASEGKGRARSFLDEQKDTAAERAHGFADALRDTARELENRGEASSTAHYAERAAEGIDRLADTLSAKNLDGLLRDTQRFARRSPALFVGGCVVAGVLIGRFLRSSHPSEESGDSSGPHGAGNGQRGQRDWQSGERLAARSDHDPTRSRENPGYRTSPSDPGSTHRSQGGSPPSGGQS